VQETQAILQYGRGTKQPLNLQVAETPIIAILYVYEGMDNLKVGIVEELNVRKKYLPRDHTKTGNVTSLPLDTTRQRYPTMIRDN
jgi:hypothetical protein